MELGKAVPGEEAAFRAMLDSKLCSSALTIQRHEGVVDFAFFRDPRNLCVPFALCCAAAAGVAAPDAATFGVDDVARLVGPERTVPVLDVAEQEARQRRPSVNFSLSLSPIRTITCSTHVSPPLKKSTEFVAGGRRRVDVARVGRSVQPQYISIFEF